jgi:hypothetical protein
MSRRTNRFGRDVFLRLLMRCARCGAWKRIDALRLDSQPCALCQAIDWMEPWELTKIDVLWLRQGKIDPEVP